MFLPTNKNEMKKQGIAQCDFILVTPDAYVDHPSFAMALLGRVLQNKGFSVGILSQPKWQDEKSFLELGEPRLAWGVSGGNMDSMVLNYTASKKRRGEDLYCEDGNPFFPNTEPSVKNKIRPDRVVTVFSNKIRSVSKNIPIIIGGIEASLRRIAHYDYWSNKVRRSVLFDAKADILIHGMGEKPLSSVLEALKRGQNPIDLQIPGTAFIQKDLKAFENALILPSFEEVKNDKPKFAEAFALFYKNQSHKIIAQKQDSRYFVQIPSETLSQKELDAVYNLPFKRVPHPRFKKIPAFEMIKNSINSHRGCYGQCSFCAISLHQGKLIQSRSQDSILNEVKTLLKQKNFDGVISDIGGPSANMYASFCKIGGCKDGDCLKNGESCPNLNVSLQSYLDILRKASQIKGIKQVFISSGLRFDTALMNEKFLEGILKKHLPGQIKIAPESASDFVLKQMRKPPVKIFENFLNLIHKVQSTLNTNKKVIPYIICGHPGETKEEFQKTLSFLKANCPDGQQFQIFTPTPMTLSSCIYYTGINPLTEENIFTEKDLKKLESQKAQLNQRKKTSFKPQNKGRNPRKRSNL